jgi:hypothetical protein
MAVELRRLQRQRLAEPLADLFHHAGRHAETRLFMKLFQLAGRERELFSLGLGQRTAQFFLLRGNALSLAGARLRERLGVGGVEWFAQIIEVKAEVVAGPVFGEHAAVAVENFPRTAGMRTVRYDCVSRWLSYLRAETTCTHHRPASKTNKPPASATASRRSCGSFFFSSSKISIGYKCPRRISRSGRKLVSVRG